MSQWVTRVLVAFLTVTTTVHADEPAAKRERDHHSYANPEHVRVTHADLDLEVLFDRQVLQGVAVLSVKRTSKDVTQPLVLDTRDLQIEKVETSADGKRYEKAEFGLGKEDALLGRSLTIPLAADSRFVRIGYATSPRATALQWLTPAQTASKRHPFLFTQSQAIEARSWIPLQDSPAVRVTYGARVRTPKELVAVMSANNDSEQKRTGEYRFEMKQAIPPYLIALAVGDLQFRRIGPRTGIYAEPEIVGKAATEFADLEEMLKAAEKLYGPYRWGRYDILVLPPSFPFGGMENPRLTFMSPTVLAGDKSLVALAAHELAHSWSGNLVSNATWRDFWLNEGFTVYLERRILEQVYGKARAQTEAVLGRRSLERELASLESRDQILHIDLKGRSPEAGLTDVPYEKGALFLMHLECVFGRERLDAFLHGYFSHFTFRSITTDEFVAYLEEHLLKKYPELAKKANVAEWLNQPGIPKAAPALTAPNLLRVEELAKAFAAGKQTAADLPAKAWTTQEWLHFLTSLPPTVTVEQMKSLDGAFGLSRTGNSEVIFQWLQLSVKHGYEPAYPRLEEFLTIQGRRKFLKPIYEELVKTPAGKERATAIYRKARPTYHPISAGTVDAILGWKE